MKVKLLLFIICVFITGCIHAEIQPNQNIKTEVPSSQSNMNTLPNPASAYCEQQGYELEIRTADDGSQSGFCIFSDGSVCDEWAYLRGECQPNSAASTDMVPNGWKIYTNEKLDYHFYLPEEANITTNDEPLNSLFIDGAAMGSETWSIAHPQDRPEFQLPATVDLLQWLTDHNLLGESHQGDAQIAGTVAIHFRHEASPQSYAFDQYFFANAGQLYMITIGHSNSTENWDLNNIFLQSFKFSTSQSAPVPTSSSTVLPGEMTSFHNWVTYTNPNYGFSIKFPDGWTVEDADSSDLLLGGHALNLHNILDDSVGNIRITFRQIGDDTLLWPTGVGEGEFVPGGTMNIAGHPALRLYLVCTTGEITQIWYHQSELQSNISRGNLEFGILFSTAGYCEPGLSIQGEILQIGEMIISSLSVP